MYLENKLKEQLDTIIDYVFKDSQEDPRLETYKWYRIRFINKTRRTFLAYYDARTRIIKMFNDVRAKNVNKYVTLIHELSHHIQFQKYGIYDYEKKYRYLVTIKVHGPEFYAIYVRLLKAAFDLKIIDYYEFMNMEKTAIEVNKIKNKLVDYVPKKVENINIDKRIYCYNSYYQKDDLKGRGYSYNAQIKAWYKELPEGDIDNEKDFLHSIHLEDENIVIKNAQTMLDMKKEVETVYKT